LCKYSLIFQKSALFNIFFPPPLGLIYQKIAYKKLVIIKIEKAAILKVGLVANSFFER